MQSHEKVARAINEGRQLQALISYQHAEGTHWINIPHFEAAKYAPECLRVQPTDLSREEIAKRIEQYISEMQVNHGALESDAVLLKRGQDIAREKLRKIFLETD